MPPIVSADTGVTEDEVLSMFDKEGNLREDPESVEENSAEEDSGDEEEQEEEGAEEPGAEEEEEDGEEDSEDEDEESEDEEEEPEAQLDWSKVPAEHKAAHEADQKEIGKLRKDYGKLHSKYAELSQSRRTDEQSMEELKAGATMAHQWNEILEQHPELEGQIIDLIKRARDPIPQEIPEELRDDPAFKYMKERYEPYIRSLEGQLKQLQNQTKPLNDWKAEQAKAEGRQKLESLLGDAAKEFKSMFGKDMSEEDKTAVLKYMVEKKNYDSGANATLAVFASQYRKALAQKDASRLKEKAKKFGTRNKGVNSRQATSSPKIQSEGDAIRQAFADQGLNL